MDKKLKVDEVTIDGQVYVPKGTPAVLADNYYIVRTYSAGVHAGELVSQEGKEVVLKNARRIWYWAGAASLSQLAVDGTSRPEECKFPCEVTEIKLLEAIEMIPCTKIAQQSIKGVPIWRK